MDAGTQIRRTRVSTPTAPGSIWKVHLTALHLSFLQIRIISGPRNRIRLFQTGWNKKMQNQQNQTLRFFAKIKNGLKKVLKEKWVKDPDPHDTNTSRIL